MMQVYAINGFAKQPGGGNPAGVVLGADHMTADAMQDLAHKLGFSETAFVLPSKVATVRVRFFTPTSEVDLCGHATIGTFSALYQLRKLSFGHYTQETRAGILAVEVTSNGTIFMEQLQPTFGQVLDPHVILPSLSSGGDVLYGKLPIQIVSTGLRDIFVPIYSRAELNRIVPDFTQIARVSEEYGVVGYHLFTTDWDLKGPGIIFCRNFAPLYGIDEESATGTSSGALACYLEHYLAKARGWAKPNHFTFNQGENLNRPSQIDVTIKNNKVWVGGIGLDLEVLEEEN